MYHKLLWNLSIKRWKISRGLPYSCDPCRTLTNYTEAPGASCVQAFRGLRCLWPIVQNLNTTNQPSNTTIKKCYTQICFKFWPCSKIGEDVLRYLYIKKQQIFSHFFGQVSITPLSYTWKILLRIRYGLYIGILRPFGTISEVFKKKFCGTFRRRPRHSVFSIIRSFYGGL